MTDSENTTEKQNAFASIGTNSSSVSAIQQKIVSFINEESKAFISKNYGIQPPPIKVFGLEAQRLQKETEKKQTEFFKKYKISKKEHDYLIDLIFFGELKLKFEIFNHTFLIRDLDPITRRFITEVGRRVFTRKGLTLLKTKTVANVLKEIDGVPIDNMFLEQYLKNMQDNFVELLYKMHLLTERYKMYLYEKLPNFVRTPTSRLRFAVCNDLKIPINDIRIMKLSEEQIYWHYINSMKTQELESDVVHARMEYLTWFINTEMAQHVSEKRNSEEESELNKIQKYSFLNGIADMVKGDVSDNELGSIMEDLMSKISDKDKTKNKDSWEEPKIPGELDPEDPFIQGLSMKVQKDQETKKSDEKEDAQFGMFGGDTKWYKE